jgi:hypothetical protein
MKVTIEINSVADIQNAVTKATELLGLIKDLDLEIDTKEVYRIPKSSISEGIDYDIDKNTRKTEIESIHSYLMHNPAIFTYGISFNSRYTQLNDYLNSFEHSRVEIITPLFTTNNVMIYLLKEYDEPYEYFVEFVIFFQPYEGKVRTVVDNVKSYFAGCESLRELKNELE